MIRYIRRILIAIYIRVKKAFALRNIPGFGGAQDETFLELQINRFFDHIGLDNSLTHTKYILPLISNLIGINKDSKILLVGPCNSKELDAFENLGYHNCDAVDLVSVDPRISVMDMHNLTFPDDTYDLVYATNVLHCSKTPKLAGNSLYRVTKKGGYLVLGVTIDLPEDDPIYATDYRSLDGLLAIFPNQLRVIYNKTIDPKSKENPHGNRFLKCIVQV